MNDLTEQALEEALAEILKLEETARERLHIKPTRFHLRTDLIADLAQQRGVSFDAMLEVIRQLVRDAGDA